MFPAGILARGLGLGHHRICRGDVRVLPAVQWFLPDSPQLPEGRPIARPNTGRPGLEAGEALTSLCIPSRCDNGCESLPAVAARWLKVQWPQQADLH